MRNIGNTKDSLVDHFTRAWDMVLEAVRNFPDAEWDKGRSHRMVPARIAYHILMSAERYTWMGKAAHYETQRMFNLDWEKSLAKELPSREEMIEHLAAYKTVTIGWIEHIGEIGLTKLKPMWPWTGTCILGQALYLLRHLQHHVAELNYRLTRRRHPAAGWK